MSIVIVFLSLVTFKHQATPSNANANANAQLSSIITPCLGATRLLLVKCYDKKWLNHPTAVSSFR